MDRPTFGRRGGSQPLPMHDALKTAAPDRHLLRAQAGADTTLLSVDNAPSLDEELRAWKQQRSFTVPWKQLCLIASICFGAASFVLPASVNSAVDWLLYGLAGMSFYVWFTGWRARRAKRLSA